MFYIFGCVFIEKLSIDDVVEAVPVHLFGGIWGTLATALLDQDFGLIFGNADMNPFSYEPKANNKGHFFLWQMIGLLAMFTWSSVISFVCLYSMKKLKILRISLYEECLGMDLTHLGGMTNRHWKEILKPTV